MGISSAVDQLFQTLLNKYNGHYSRPEHTNKQLATTTTNTFTMLTLVIHVAQERFFP